MAQWADILIPGAVERVALEARALFFVPDAVERCAHAHLTATTLANLESTRARQAGITPSVGRNAISKVLRLVPVTYKSAVGVIDVINAELPTSVESLTLSDIIACVFRLKDPAEVMSALEIPVEELALRARISHDLAVSALPRYRLQFVDAYSIWQCAVEKALIMSERGTSALIVRQLITNDPRDLLKTDARPDLPMAVRQTADGSYVYGWSNLKKAPNTGHPWSIAG